MVDCRTKMHSQLRIKIYIDDFGQSLVHIHTPAITKGVLMSWYHGDLKLEPFRLNSTNIDVNTQQHNPPSSNAQSDEHHKMIELTGFINKIRQNRIDQISICVLHS